MNDNLFICIIIVTVVAAIFFAWYFYQQARNRERLLMIEKGHDLNEISRKEKASGITMSFPWLKLGIVVIGLSIGFAMISLFFTDARDEELFRGFLIVSIIGFSLGLPLILNHFIGKRLKET